MKNVFSTVFFLNLFIKKPKVQSVKKKSFKKIMF